MPVTFSWDGSGEKAPKSNPFLGPKYIKMKGRAEGMMTENVLHFSYYSKIPILPIKRYYRRSMSKSKGFNFLVCTDGSQKSLEGFQQAKTLATNYKDKIFGVCLVGVALELEKTEVEETINGRIKELGIKCEMEFIEGTEVEPFNALLNHLNAGIKQDFDFVLVFQ
jgi:hypothetical protein